MTSPAQSEGKSAPWIQNQQGRLGKHPNLGLSNLVGVLIQTHFLEQLGDVLRSGGSSFWKQNPELLKELLS